jgi:hypothetical protein
MAGAVPCRIEAMSRFEQPPVVTAANVSAPKTFRFMLSSFS